MPLSDWMIWAAWLLLLMSLVALTIYTGRKRLLDAWVLIWVAGLCYGLYEGWWSFITLGVWMCLVVAPTSALVSIYLIQTIESWRAKLRPTKPKAGI